MIGYVTLNTLKAAEFPNLPIVSPTEVWPYVFHGWFLVIIMYVAAITGFGRKVKESRKD